MVLLIAPVQGHVVTQIFGEWKDSKTWEIEVLFDAGYAVPEWRGDAQAEAPTRDWLLGLGEKGWIPLRAEAERYLRECLSVKSGGRWMNWRVQFPDFDVQPPDFPLLLNDGAYFRMRIMGEVRLADEARIFWSEGKRPTLVLRLPGAESRYLTLRSGESAPLPVAAQKVGRASWVETFQQGFLHVLPLGLDHVLFVLGLFFYRREWRPLLWQSLSFTAAHTLTLGLAAVGFVRISGNWVEPMIAMSLVVVALENFRPSTAIRQRLRLALVFGFGLIHGLGFAGALSVWLPPGEGFLTGLLTANAGVEVAQVVLLGVAWILTQRWCDTRFYQGARIACCLGIAAVGLMWAIQRLV
jgi:hypothetical protein